MKIKYSIAISVIIPWLFLVVFFISNHYDGLGSSKNIAQYIFYHEKLAYVELFTVFFVYLLVILFINHLIVLPITQLNDSVKKICQGNFKVNFGCFKRDDEVGVLACNLSKITTSMKLAVYRDKK